MRLRDLRRSAVTLVMLVGVCPAAGQTVDDGDPFASRPASTIVPAGSGSPNDTCFTCLPSPLGRGAGGEGSSLTPGAAMAVDHFPRKPAINDDRRPQDIPSPLTPLPRERGTVRAKQVPPPVPNSAELLERLRAAEQRIADLEANRGRPAASETGYAAISDDAPPVESSAESDDATSQVVDDLTQKLDDLQKEWDKHQEALKKAADDAAKKPTFNAGGRIQLDYWSFLQDSEGIEFFEHPDPADPQYGTDPENRFLFRRVRLELSGDVPDLMFWRIQADFNHPENPQIKDVYLGWHLPNNHRLILGHQKMPMGLDALYSSRWTTTVERPQVTDAFVTDYRRLGAEVYGFSEDKVFNWQYGLFEMQNLQNEGSYVGDSMQLGAVGRLASTPWYDETSNGRGYLHLGISGSVVRPDGDVTDADSNSNVARFSARPEGRTDGRWLDTGPIDGADWYEQNGLEAVLTLGSLQLTGEFMSTWVQRDDTTPGTGPNVYFHGGYVQATYFLTGEHMAWNREMGVVERIRPFENFFLIDRCTGGTGTGWGAWQVVGRYDYLDLTDADIEGGVENNLTLGVNWWWNSHARMQFNATRGLIEQHREVGGFDSGDFWLAGTRFAIDF